jgi:hypothetical protein
VVKDEIDENGNKSIDLSQEYEIFEIPETFVKEQKEKKNHPTIENCQNRKYSHQSEISQFSVNPPNSNEKVRKQAQSFQASPFKFHCKKCSKLFIRKKPYLKHLKTHQMNRQIDNPKILDEIPITKMRGQIFTCKESSCDYKTKFKNVFVRHENSHQLKMQKCPILSCDFSSFYDKKMKFHMERRHFGLIQYNEMQQVEERVESEENVLEHPEQFTIINEQAANNEY